MRKREWMEYAAAVLLTGALLSGCGNIRKLSKSDPEAEVHLPARTKRERAYRAADTVRPPRIITFHKQDGTELFLTPVALDSASGEKIMSVNIDEVVISAANRRNLVERNGKINVEFIVTVPQELQDRSWQLVIGPQLLKGDDTLSFDPLVYSGERYRAMQQREYGRYDDYLARIVDSADYFDRFADKGAYRRYMNGVAAERAEYADAAERLGSLAPDEAMFDPKVGWATEGESRRRYKRLRRYVYATDRIVQANTIYTSDPNDKFDHLNDYFAPRYRYEGIDVLPGGEIFTRIEGDYAAAGDREREAYIRSLSKQPAKVYAEVYTAGERKLRDLAADRLAYTGRRRPAIEGLLEQTSDSTMLANYRSRKEAANDRLAELNDLDTAAVRQSVLRQGAIARNRRLEEGKPEAFGRMVRHPYLPNARLDTVVVRPDGKIDYYYSQPVQADENTAKLRLYLTGEVEDRSGRTYRLTRSDTLTYDVASMTSFLDERTRYMQRIVLRDAEANARFFFTFPVGKARLVDTLTENRRQIAAVRSLTHGLMTDPVYIIDSITLRATASPEGTWVLNDRLARDRAEALRQVLVSEFRTLYDSLRVAGSYTLDGSSITPGFHIAESVWKRDMPTQHTVEILFLCGTDAIRTTFVVPVNNYSDAEYQSLQSAQYPYQLHVVRNQCTVLVYGLDKSGEYSILHHAFVCGPGQTTPIGTFRTPFKAAWHPLQGCWGQYCTQIVGNYLFHSSPYNSPNKNDLSYRLYNQLGTVCSHGCVRLTVADAKWIYDNCPLGTTVKIYNASSLPVPKPSAPWLDITSPNRGWDPTDPDPANPWRQ